MSHRLKFRYLDVYTDLSAEHPPEGHAGILFHCLEPQPNVNFKIENGFF